MPAMEPDQGRQRVAIGQDHRTTGVARQPLHRLRTGRAMGREFQGRFHIHRFSGYFSIIGAAARFHLREPFGMVSAPHPAKYHMV